jgi:hypothetical protein
VTGHDDDFDDFLARRRKLFRRPEDDVLEPPHEVDRIVLRQAREAIESRHDQREIRGMAWGAPLALAASLLVAFTIILNVGLTKKEPVAEVTVEQVAQRRDYPPAPTVDVPMAGAPIRDVRSEATVGTPSVYDNSGHPILADRQRGGLVSEDESHRHAPAPPPPPAATPDRTAAADSAAAAGERVVVAPPPPSEAERAVARSSGTPSWRHDAGSWLAEIQRLRAEGKTAEADAELAEFKRQHRAYAGSPDH